MTSQLSVQMCSQTTMATCLWLGNALKTAGPANPSQKLRPLRSYTMSSQLLLTLEVLHVRLYKINVQIVSTSSAFFAASLPLINTRVRCAWRKPFVDHGHSEVKAAQIHLGAVRDKLWCLWVSTNMVYKSNIPGVCFWKEKTQKQDSWCVPECLDTQIPYRIWDPGSSPRSPAFSPEPSPPQKVKPLELTWWQRLPKWNFQVPSQGEGKFANHGATMTAMKQRVPEPKRTRMGLACKHLTTPALLAQTRFSTQEYSKDWTSK